MSVTLRSKMRGCIIGQCLGDALGYPIEGHDADTCCHFAFDKVGYWFRGETPISDHWTGQYTDDSQLARELLISLMEHNGFNGDDYAARIVTLFKNNTIVGRGLATDEAVHRLLNGVHWKESGCPPPSAGNGTAMRAAPMGLFYHDDPEKLIEAAHLQGWITHQDPRCSAGSVAIAGAVALAIQSDELNTQEFLAKLSGWASVYSRDFAQFITGLNELVLLPPHKAIDAIADAGKPFGYADEWPGISPFVVCSVLWSLYCFLRYPTSYWDAISTAISVGGDVDTTGAMTGAVSGAFVGLEGIPDSLAQLVHDRNTWGYDELLALVDRCFKVKAKRPGA